MNKDRDISCLKFVLWWAVFLCLVQNIKKLLKIVYSKSSVSMMVHRVGNTLMLDEFDIHRYLLRQQDEDWKWLRKFFYETVLRNMKQHKRVCCALSVWCEQFMSLKLRGIFSGPAVSFWLKNEWNCRNWLKVQNHNILDEKWMKSHQCLTVCVANDCSTFHKQHVWFSNSELTRWMLLHDWLTVLSC